MTQITRWVELFAYPLGTVFVDNMGDAWMLDHYVPIEHLGAMPYLIAPETRAMAASLVLNKYGPLEIAYVPNERGLW